MNHSDKIMRTVKRIIEGLTLNEMIDGNVTVLDLTLAIEIVASLNRRQIRDRGCTKDQYREVQEAASEVAGIMYEQSGLGKKIRDETANGTSDSGFTAKQWQDAEAMATDAINKAINGGDR